MSDESEPIWYCQDEGCPGWLVPHEAAAHYDENMQGPFTCIVCDEVFSGRDGFEEHNKDVHRGDWGKR